MSAAFQTTPTTATCARFDWCDGDCDGNYHAAVGQTYLDGAAVVVLTFDEERTPPAYAYVEYQGTNDRSATELRDDAQGALVFAEAIRVAAARVEALNDAAMHEVPC